MLLTLVRHGESWGQIDNHYEENPDPALTPLGERQAAATGRQLATEGITQIVASPMRRALATAVAIAEACGIACIPVWPEIREGFTGRHWGMTSAELLAQFPRARLDEGVDEAAWRVGDASFDAYWARCAVALARVRESFNDHDRVVLVAHGGSCGVMLHQLLGIPPTAARAFNPPNCSLSRFRIEPDPTPTFAHDPLYPLADVVVQGIAGVAHLVGV